MNKLSKDCVVEEITDKGVLCWRIRLTRSPFTPLTKWVEYTSIQLSQMKNSTDDKSKFDNSDFFQGRG